MDFEKVLNIIIRKFDENNIDYALIGGFAIGLLGIMRATMDIDFLINKNNMLQVDEILKKYGYKCLYQSDYVAQYISDLKPLGTIDIIFASKPISLEMLAQAITIKLFNNSLNIKVLKPEDIIAFKLQAIINDKSREIFDYSDIELLLDYYKKEIDWNKLKKYFGLFNLLDKYNDLKIRYGQINE